MTARLVRSDETARRTRPTRFHFHRADAEFRSPILRMSSLDDLPLPTSSRASLFLSLSVGFYSVFRGRFRRYPDLICPVLGKYLEGISVW